MMEIQLILIFFPYKSLLMNLINMAFYYTTSCAPAGNAFAYSCLTYHYHQHYATSTVNYFLDEKKHYNSFDNDGDIAEIRQNLLTLPSLICPIGVCLGSKKRI